MLNDEVAVAVARFFDAGSGPSHDELSRLFARHGLSRADPLAAGEVNVGKMKRVRAVLLYAAEQDHRGGNALTRSLLDALRATGSFRQGSQTYAGDDLIGAAASAFNGQGYHLDETGHLRPRVLDNLDGADLTAALDSYVTRARTGAEDAALLVGTSKDLLEATARHVLVQTTGAYQSRDFASTLYLAYDRLGLLQPPQACVEALDPNPWLAIEQALWLLGIAVNRLRNAEGTGHGRPFPTSISGDQSRVAVESIGVVSQLLLDALQSQRG